MEPSEKIKPLTAPQRDELLQSIGDWSDLALSGGSRQKTAEARRKIQSTSGYDNLRQQVIAEAPGQVRVYRAAVAKAEEAQSSYDFRFQAEEEEPDSDQLRAMFKLVKEAGNQENAARDAVLKEVTRIMSKPENGIDMKRKHNGRLAMLLASDDTLRGATSDRNLLRAINVNDDHEYDLEEARWEIRRGINPNLAFRQVMEAFPQLEKEFKRNYDSEVGEDVEVVKDIPYLDAQTRAKLEEVSRIIMAKNKAADGKLLYNENNIDLKFQNFLKSMDKHNLALEPDALRQFVRLGLDVEQARTTIQETLDAGYTDKDKKAKYAVIRDVIDNEYKKLQPNVESAKVKTPQATTQDVIRALPPKPKSAQTLTLPR